MNASELARRIQTALGLDLPPVSLTFVDKAPSGLPTPASVAPSACSWWRAAEHGTFYASAQTHYNCPVGSMVMGFELPQEVHGRLGELVSSMCAQGYLSSDEPSHIPTMKRAYAGIVYGPLAEGTLEPDVVLLWVSAQQAMLCNEAMGTAAWTAGPPITTGRPGCAVLPLALAADSVGLSLGCAGMRTFTGIGTDRMLIAVPGRRLADFAAALERTSAVNDQMINFYEGQLAQVATTTE